MGVAGMLVTQHARSARHGLSHQDRHLPRFTDEKSKFGDIKECSL